MSNGEKTQVVSLAIATDTVNDWLNFKRIPLNKREALQSMIDNMVNAVVEGDLVLDEETKVWKHTLIFPEGAISELTYKPRISDRDTDKYAKAAKGTDFQAIMKRTILALTDAPLGVINALDSSTDKQIAESIAIFFV